MKSYKVEVIKLRSNNKAKKEKEKKEESDSRTDCRQAAFGIKGYDAEGEKKEDVLKIRGGLERRGY